MMDNVDTTQREPLNITEFPCKYGHSGALRNETFCHMELSYIDPKDFPTVSILTPTYNRRLFQDLMIRNWQAIDYPRDKLEWIIVDDSEKSKKLDPNKFNLSGVRYIYLPQKLKLGKKRNFLATLAHGEIMVHMDDDDFYPPENVVSRVKTLLLSKGKECVGCTKTLCYDLIHDQTFEAFDPSSTDPLIPCTISESSLAYTKKFWEEQRYNDEDTFGECLNFIKGRHDQLISIPYIFVVTQLSHSDNTIKRWMLRSTKHTVQFTDNLSMMDNLVIQDLRAKVVMEFPDWKDAIKFLKKNHGLTIKKFLKLLTKPKTNPTLKTNHLVLQHIRSYVTSNKPGNEIVYYCGPGRYLDFGNIWDGNTQGLGGSEEAVVNLSEQFVKLGYSVTVYNLVPTSRTINGVDYKPYYTWFPLDNKKLTIIWRDPSHLDTKINSKTILDLHDVIDSGWLSPDRLKNVYSIYCKSEFHKKLILNQDIDCDVRVIPNGINSKSFETKVVRDKNIIMCTSSPDRCLTSLLEALPIIRNEPGLENTEIHWAYGFKSGIAKGGMEAHTDPKIKEWVVNSKQRIKETDGFVNLGRISHSEVVKLCKTANVYAYGTSFPEIDCISMTKAMAGGAIPVIVKTGALKEKIKYYNNILKNETIVKPVMTYESLDYSITGIGFDLWCNEIIKMLKTNVSEELRTNMSKRVCEDYDWENISKDWLKD